MAYLIPVLYCIGVIGYFLIPNQNIQLTNFIIYLSSLSTIIMILVHVFTTSQQLDAMNSQLEEMKYSRDVQSQPFILFENLNVRIQAPKYFFNPAQRRDISIYSQFYFSANIKNIGNSHGISIEVYPKIVTEEGEIIKEGTLGGSFECISNEKIDIRNLLMVVSDMKHIILEKIVNREPLFYDISIFYKNLLGMTFLQQSKYVFRPNIDDMDDIKTYMTTTLTSHVEYKDELEEYLNLYDKDRYEDAGEIHNNINEKIISNYKTPYIDFRVALMSGSLSVSPITKSNYDSLLEQKNNVKKEMLAPFPEVPWFLRTEMDDIQKERYPDLFDKEDPQT